MMNNELIQSKVEYSALEGLMSSEGFAVYCRLLTAEMQKEYDSMMNEKISDAMLKTHRDKMLGIKFALDVPKTVLNSYKGKFNEK